MSDALAPLLVYDAATREGGFPNTSAWLEAFMSWLRLYGVDPYATYRVEFYLFDAPFIRVYQYAVQDCSLHVVDGVVVHRPPFDVITSAPAPRPEDYR